MLALLECENMDALVLIGRTRAIQITVRHRATTAHEVVSQLLYASCLLFNYAIFLILFLKFVSGSLQLKMHDLVPLYSCCPSDGCLG